MQVEGSVDQVMSLEPLIDKFLSFGWNTISCNGNKITEGHDGNTLYNADMYSNEKYNLQNSVAKSKSRIINQDNVNLEIELVLKELEKTQKFILEFFLKFKLVIRYVQ